MSRILWKIYIDMYNAQKRDGKIKANDLSIEALVLTYLYPRLDVNVTNGINHLLKSPWCIHPKTGKSQIKIMTSKPLECTNWSAA